MILRRLELKNFGRFSESAFDFRRGLNLVSGASESGKTTLAEAVPCILFGTSDPERFRPWHGEGGCSAALVFEEAGRSLRIERDFLTDRVLLQETDAEGRSLHSFSGKVASGSETAEAASYRSVLERLFGGAEEDPIRFALLLEQGFAMRFASAGRSGGLPALLANMTGDESSSVSGSAAEIEAVRRRLAELERLWYDTRKALADLDEIPGQIAELEALLEADRTELASRESSLEERRRKVGGEQRPASPVAPATGSSGQLALVKGFEERHLHLERELAKTGLPRQMPADLPGVLVQADEIRQEMIAIQQEAAELRQRLLKLPTPSWKPAVLVTLLSLLLVGAVAWQKPEWLAAGALAGALATSAGWAIFLWRLGQDRQARSRLKKPLQTLEESREEAQARLSGLDERFSRMGLSPSAVEIVRMQKNLDRHLRLLQEVVELEKARGESGSLGKSAAVEGRVAPALAETKDQRPVAAPAVAATSQVEETATADKELAGLAELLQSREAELDELTRLVAGREGLREELQRIEEEGEALRRRETELARRPSAVSPVTAGGKPRMTLKQLGDDVGQTLAILTADRYTEVRFDADGACLLRGIEGRWHPLQHFSRGTLESFCLALRLVLGRRMAGDRRLPLILDDVLAAYDQARLDNALKLLEYLAGEQQVILLSGDPALRKRAGRDRWHTITLAEEDRQKTSRLQERSDDDGQLHLL